jgi:hypothetical protein
MNCGVHRKLQKDYARTLGWHVQSARKEAIQDAPRRRIDMLIRPNACWPHCQCDLPLKFSVAFDDNNSALLTRIHAQAE